MVMIPAETLQMMEQETKDRLADARKVREWQPIETLPRDGRYVLAYRPLAMETGDETLAVVKTMKNPTVSPQGVKHWTSRWCHPTHWMDIPAPPAPDLQ